MFAARITDTTTGEWQEHPRFPGILMKSLLTTADNALANVNLVQVPPGREVGRHIHPTQIETVYLITGRSVLTVGDMEAPLKSGHIVAIPIGTEYALRNVGPEPVELLAFFTPPIS
ncbi:MAG TPA: cupin domain-containing protein [Anaerolineales bacterium]|nr:cupin domain-containing protein [Anaerolineales bacterium]